MVAHQTSGAEVPGSNPAYPTMILGRCKIIVLYCSNLRVEGGTSTRSHKYTHKKLSCQTIMIVLSHLFEHNLLIVLYCVLGWSDF